MRLETQLLDYIDELAPPVTAEEAIARRQSPNRSRPVLVWALAGVIVLLIAGFGLVRTFDSDSGPVATSESPLIGTWMTADDDGSTPTMTVQVFEEGVVEIVVLDDFASVCSGAPSTMTGTGRLDSDTVVVVPEPILTCDDGSRAQALDGGDLEEILRDLTFTHDPINDTLSDNLGAVWTREGAEGPSPDPTTTVMWPQASLEEVQEAQGLADAGHPDYAWQVDEALADCGNSWERLHNGQVELVDRFVREVLGWEAYRQSPLEDCADGSLTDHWFLRCGPNRTNPLYSDEPCSPTMDELTYESVSLDLVQPDRKGSDGIWVVSNWRPTTFVQADPAVAETQATERLEEFLAARIAGNAAEEYVEVYAEWLGQEFPLLYAATSGAPYERYEFEVVDGPEWPFGGYIGFEIRLFTEDGTVVEQNLRSDWDGGDMLWLVGMTAEDGQPVPMVHAWFDGEITFSSASQTSALIRDDREGVLDFTDPALSWSECRQDPVPVDAVAFAQALSADPNFETTALGGETIGGIPAVAIDVALPSGSVCGPFRTHAHPYINTLEPPLRQRLYLVDVPEGMSMRTLAITVTAPESRFEEVIEQAQPIIDSIEFHTG